MERLEGNATSTLPGAREPDSVTGAANALYQRQRNSIMVNDALLEDLGFLYAAQALAEDAEEAFMERMADEDFRAVIRQIFCRACLAVNAALEMDDEGLFSAYVHLLDLPNLACDDEVLAELLRFTVQKLADDAGEATEETGRFEARMKHVSVLVS